MTLEAMGMDVFPTETGRERCITLDKLLKFSVSSFLILKMRIIRVPILLDCSEGLMEITSV